jgi:hypothetical protein
MTTVAVVERAADLLSVTIGVGHRATCSVSGREFRPKTSSLTSPLLVSLTRGVAHQERVAPVRLSRAPGWFPQLSESSALGVGQDEESLATMRSPDFLRSEESRLNAETHCSKVISDFSQAQGNVACDILEEAPRGVGLSDDAPDMRPEVSRILGSSSVTGV